MMKIVAPVALAAALTIVAPAYATQIPNGTLSVSVLQPPAVSLGATTSTYTGNNQLTFETAGTGGFASAVGFTGLFNGAITFSNTLGATLAASLPNLFTFSGFTFSATSVQTTGFSNLPGSKAFSLFLLGDTSGNGYSATPTSLTLSFNSTGTSAYSSSATLSVPPAVPEPASWALMLGGFGLMGVALRSRKAAVSFG